MSERTRRGRSARRWQPGRYIDMEAVRQLAREAAAYQEVPVGPQQAGPHRSAFVAVERHPWDWADGDPVIVHQAEGPETGPEPWRHQWSVFESDVTPWMSPEERAAAARAQDVVADEAKHEQARFPPERGDDALHGSWPDEYPNADMENDLSMELE